MSRVVMHSSINRLGFNSTSYRPAPGVTCRRKQIIVYASSDDKKPKSDNTNKADISAQIALRFRQFFSKRYKYLRELDRAELAYTEPEVIKKLNEKIAAQEAALKEATEPGTREQQLASDAEVDEQAKQMMQGYAAKLTDGTPVISSNLTSASIQNQLVAQDVQRAKAHLASPGVQATTITFQRVTQLLRDFVLLPVTLITAMHASWTSLFSSQRYENFLMAEGERIWYWRNRQENERWFWQVLFWERLTFPAICTIGYEYIVPCNLMWAVVVPLTFITWQTKQLPSIFSLEVWLIAIFGLYGKCWGDVVWFLQLLFQWF